MIRLTKKQRQAQELQDAAKTIGIEKFRHYAVPRSIELQEESYGMHKVIHNGKSSCLEAVRATDKDGNPGWVINMANRRRRFIADAQGYVVI